MGARLANRWRMASDLASVILRRSIDALGGGETRCSACRRTPLAGELLHELESRRHVCQLCLARLPESKRDTLGVRRIPVSERPLSVVPRAA